ncbi:MAG: alpha/beta hydrolase, partial [Ktedonobacteraceae bacterium]
MDPMQSYDPELVAALQMIPIDDMIDWNDLPAGREFARKMFEELAASIPASPNVVKEDRMVPGPQGAHGVPEVPVRIYRPVASTGMLPGFLWIHGGGYVPGNIEQDDSAAQHIV